MSSGQLIANILGYGDMHLTNRQYGSHRNYPQESLEYFEAITLKAEEIKATHIIGHGDISTGRFTSLEYRTRVEEYLERQYSITNGRRYEIKGNHDESTAGMTEYEFYTNKGLIKPSENIQIGNLNLSMVDYGKVGERKILTPEEQKVNLVLAHDYIKFTDSQLPNYGKKYIDLDYLEEWFGVDMVICGHIHKYSSFDGIMFKGDKNKRVAVMYTGCMTRPAYTEGHMDELGYLWNIQVYDDGTINFDLIKIPLWPLEKSFNLEFRIAEQQRKEERKVDVTDVVQALNTHKRVVGSPEDRVMAMDNIDIKYRKKAVELLGLANMSGG